MSALDLGADSLDDLLLTVSEAVTNTVRYGNGGRDDTIELVLAVDSKRVRIDVSDNGPGLTPGPPAPRLERGGDLELQLVDALSARWGVDGTEHTRIWFEFRPAHP